MGLYLRLVIGPVVVCDLELFGTTRPASSADNNNDPPPQLAGGSGTLTYPDDVTADRHFGF